MAFVNLNTIYNNIESQYDSLSQLLESENLKDNEVKVLWTGAHYMSETQTANLSEKVSEQRNGIVLHWQRYDNPTLQNYGHNYHFIPKTQAITCPGLGVNSFMVSGTGFFGWKYTYINDQSIVGFKKNNDAAYVASTSKITLNPQAWVLVEVLGV